MHVCMCVIVYVCVCVHAYAWVICMCVCTCAHDIVQFDSITTNLSSPYRHDMHACSVAHSVRKQPMRDNAGFWLCESSTAIIPFQEASCCDDVSLVGSEKRWKVHAETWCLGILIRECTAEAEHVLHCLRIVCS